MSDLTIAAMSALWFGIQVLQGAFQLTQETAGEIAWWAHIAGFVVGFAIAGRLAKAPSPPAPWRT